MKPTVVILGEVLWDILPKGEFLGGAPFNVACHLHALGHVVHLASRVGPDARGKAIRRNMIERGLSTAHLQTDPTYPTGIVQVTLDARGQPTYEIAHPAAWDALTLTSDLHHQIYHADILIFGSLAQREIEARKTIQAAYASPALKVFDINLRPPFVDRTLMEKGLQAADLVKLNREELGQIGSWYDFPVEEHAGCAALAERFDCRAVCLTRGADGATLWYENQWWTHAGFPVAVQDTIGAGDAFLAGFLAQWIAEAPIAARLDFANCLAAFTVTQDGATPILR